MYENKKWKNQTLYATFEKDKLSERYDFHGFN